MRIKIIRKILVNMGPQMNYFEIIQIFFRDETLTARVALQQRAEDGYIEKSCWKKQRNKWLGWYSFNFIFNNQIAALSSMNLSGIFQNEFKMRLEILRQPCRNFCNRWFLSVLITEIWWKKNSFWHQESDPRE
mgnify:CR=1 FL=1